MKLIAPHYYTDFACIAGKCRHSCCIGWEIDIDADTAAYYQTVGGELGKKLSRHMDSIDGQASFHLTEDERCPFLNSGGLCELIVTLGENVLCQICRDHPRFRNVFSDRTEIGLGLCCEAAAELILKQTAETSLVVLSDDHTGATPYTEDTLFFKQRDALFQIAQDRSLSIDAREHRLLKLVERNTTPLTPLQFLQIYEPLERLEDTWTAQLSLLHDAENGLVNCPDSLTVPFEQLLVYFLYRHLPDARDDGRFASRVAFAVQSVRLLRLLCAINGNTLEALMALSRMYSAEIEYSEDNQQTLLSVF